jgi:hypothetical protein
VFSVFSSWISSGVKCKNTKWGRGMQGEFFRGSVFKQEFFRGIVKPLSSIKGDRFFYRIAQY